MRPARCRHRPLGRRGDPDRRGRLDVPGRGLGRPARHLAARRRRSRSRPAGRRAGPRGGRAAVRRGRRRRARDAERDTLWDVAVALRDDRLPPQVRLAAATGARGGRGRVAATRCASWSPAPSGSPLRVERERALYGSWYEFFPRSEGAVLDAWQAAAAAAPSRTAAERLPAVAAMGFDVVYLPPIHPIGRSYRKGPNNTLDAGPDDPGVPWAIGSRRGRPRRDPSRPRHDRRLRRLRRDGRATWAWRSRSTSRCSARPTTRGSPSTRSGSRTGPTARSRTRRTRRRSTRTSTRSTSTTTRTGIYAEALRDRCGTGWPTACGSSASTTRTPSRSRSGSGCSREVARDRPRRALPGRGVHPAGDDAPLGEVGFQQSYTYFTWRTAKWELEEYLTELSTETAPLHAAQLLREHPGHPARVPAVRRPAGVQDPRRARRDAVADLGRLRRLRAVRARRRAPGQRGVPGLGEVPAAAARLGGGRGARAAASRRT